MKVAIKRWGEVTIKKQGDQKNQFDKTMSFSIQRTKHEYTIDQLKELFTLVVNLSERYPFDNLRKKLNMSRLKKDSNRKILEKSVPAEEVKHK